MLALAPTGSGKTLAAFLHALSGFASGDLDANALSVLYVSPLKALNEDIRLNLLDPVRGLERFFADRGQAFPKVRVATRSGDTAAAERRGILKHPPSVLCTTPESLAIMLASKSGRGLLASVKLAVVDELHAVLGGRRGTLLACSLGMLAELAGEYQRVALSATLRDPEAAAGFVGGAELSRAPDGTAVYKQRAVDIVQGDDERRLSLSVLWPQAPVRPPVPGLSPDAQETDAPASRYAAVVRDLAKRLPNERGVIMFADSRRRAERLAAMLNEEAGDGTAWAHHGSLSKDVRRAVERKLKEGRLPCVVATSSLELGIDVGSIDLVALAGTPSRADQAIQRIGRSGHRVGAESRGLLYPFHAPDVLQAAALAGAVRDRELDPVRPLSQPLDVLAQVILSAVLWDELAVQDVFDRVRAYSPYRDLGREDFDAVLATLAGRLNGSRSRDLTARVWLDDEHGTLRAKDGAAMLLYGSGGAIADRGYYSLRLAGSGERIGELDEEFVFERRVGNSFTLGAMAWKIVAIGDEAVEVQPLDRAADFMPFWKAEKAARGAGVSGRMLRLCALFQDDPEAFRRELAGLDMDASSRDRLDAFLSAQARAGGGLGLPGAGRVVLELYKDPARSGDAVPVFVHTLRGLAVNEPLGLAVSGILAENLGVGVDVLANDDSVWLLVPLPDPASAARAVKDAFKTLGDGRELARRLRARVATSAAFGAAFRECAARSLLLPKAGFGRRTPLWITRLRAKRLFERLSGAPDVPAIKESWHLVLDERYDLPALAAVLADLAAGAIELSSFVSTVPSPLARGSGWMATNRYLYDGDELPSGAADAGSYADRALAQALDHEAQRPAIPGPVYAAFMARLLREDPGWAPDSPDALADWVDERVAVPLDEWERLLAACPADLAAEAVAALEGGARPGPLGRLARLRLPGAGMDLVVHQRRRSLLKAGPYAWLPEWLRGGGIVALSRLGFLTGAEPALLDGLCAALSDEGAVVLDASAFRVDGWPPEPAVCDRDILDGLLRSVRSAARPAVKPRPEGSLAAFLAVLHGLGRRNEDLSEVLRRLSGYPARAGLWETAIFPSRVSAYSPDSLDALVSSGSVLWYGQGDDVAFCSPDDWELFWDGSRSSLIAPGRSPVDVWAIRDSSGLDLAALRDAMRRELRFGRISSDSFEPRRKAWPGASGADAGQARFPERHGARPGHPRVPLALRDRWKAGPPVPGRWFSLELEQLDLDPADIFGLDTRRARIAALRYGVVARGVLERDAPGLRWGRLFPAFRRMELAGELVCGRFFAELEGPQFMDTDAYALWKDGAEETGIWSVSAADPASLAGMDLGGRAVARGLKPPARLAGNWLAYRGGELACVSRQGGRELDVSLRPDDPDLEALLSFLVMARERAVDPQRKIVVARVNSQPAADGPWSRALSSIGFERDRGTMTLW